MTDNMAKKPVRWPGGVLLVAVGMSPVNMRMAIDQLSASLSATTSLTVLADAGNAACAHCADEVWVYQRLGLRGFLALIRRISWRHFDRVYQPVPAALPVLRFLVWPRPPWFVNLAERRQA
ncbi:MAG: hypothetical protein ACPGGG_08750 [Parvibaculales bacterium]